MAEVIMNDIFTYHDIFGHAGGGIVLLAIVLIVMIGFWRFLNMDAER